MESFIKNQRLWHYGAKFFCLIATGYFVWKSYVGFHNANNDLRLLLLLVADLYTMFVVMFSRYSEQVMRRPHILLITTVSSCYFIFLELQTGKVILPYAYGKWIQMSGISLQLWAKVALGKSFGLLPANRGVVTTGPYRWLRHPMYLGYFVNHVGFLLCTFSLYNCALYVALYVMVIFRLFKEEELLSQDAAYQLYRQKVHYRFLPPIF